MDSLDAKVDFNIIRYANCWEDADILLQGLSLAPGSKILSIGSAGDNSLALLATNPKLVVAVDINKTQLHLIKLKLAAIKNLSYNEVLAFLGFDHSPARKAVFNTLKGEISKEAATYWQNNIAVIEQGLIYGGKFEKYFGLFSKRVLPLIHTDKTIAGLLASKTSAEQQSYYHQTWNNWRWKLLFKIFFSQYVMGKYGRDPEFMKEVRVPVSQTIYNRAAAHLQTQLAQHNFMLRFSLTGNFGTEMPFYLRKDNYGIIKSNLDKLVLCEGYAQRAIDTYGKFNAMNLSNIFEYMDSSTFYDTAEALINGMEKSGRLAYWNLMVPRQISQLFREVVYQKELSAQLTEKDKGFFYNRFVIDTVI
jgi:S-adenosylmethionine-diacylglycerol 3-amino-3-carboxypropyl transferase